MSHTDKDMDKLFKEASDKQVFVFEDSFWTEMQGELNATSSKKRKPFIFWISGAVILLVTGLTSVLVWNGKETKLITQNKSTLTEMKTLSSVDKSNKSLQETNNGSQLHSTKTNEVERGNIEPVSKEHNTEKSYKNRLVEEVVVGEISTVNNTEQFMISQNKSNEVAISNRQEGDVLLINAIDALSLLPLVEISNDNFSPLALRTILPLAAPNHTKHKLYYEFGASLGQALVVASDKPNTGFYAGLGYKLDKKSWGLKTGLNLSLQQTNGLQMVKRSVVYGFSSTTYSETSDVSQLLSLQMPIMIYGKANKQRVYAGIVPGYNMAMRSSKQSYREGEKIEHGEGFSNADNFNPFLLDLKVGYGFQLFTKTQIGFDLTTRATRTIFETSGLQAKSFPIMGTVFLHFDF
jgi:hypothetical protein